MRRFFVPLAVLCVHGVAVRLYEAEGRRRAPAVAAVVPVHPPHFKFLSSFLQQWQNCTQALSAMDVFVVFSSRADAAEFQRFSSSAAASACDAPVDVPGLKKPCDRPPYRELIVTPSGVDPKNYKAWKKLDGLAQLLERPGSQQYEFAVMMDAEIAVSNCQGFARLLPMLRQKHGRKIVYGYKSMASYVHKHMHAAACAISASVAPANTSKEGPAANDTGFATARRSGISCDPTVLDRLGTALDGFTVYTWWNDLPYVHMETAGRMFSSWAAALETAKGKSAGAAFRHRALSSKVAEWMAVVAQRLPTPTEVSSAMGSPPKGAEELGVAAQAFEHAVYQMYTLGYEGFAVSDIRRSLHSSPDLDTVVTGGECFCALDPQDKGRYARLVEPLWQAHGCEPFDMPYGKPLLRFHMNRVMKRGR